MRNIIDKVLIFVLVLSGGGILFVLNRNSSYWMFFCLLVISFLFFGNKLKKNIVNILVLTFLSCVGIFFLNYFFAIAEQSLLKYLFFILMSVISILMIAYFKNNDNESSFVYSLHSVLKIFLFHGVVNFFMYFFINQSLFELSNNTSHYSCETFNYLFYYLPEINIINISGFEFCRNQGFFWEPGVFQVFLNILFFIEAFIIKRSNKLLLLTAFVILTTYSTTGLILLLIQVIVLATENHKSKIISIPLIVLLIIPIYVVFNLNVEDKMHGDRETSFQIRLFDLVQPFAIALEHPLTGIGLDRDQFVKYRFNYFVSMNFLTNLNEYSGLELTKSGTSLGSTNSLMFLLAGAGFPTTILLLYMLAKQQLIKKKKWLLMIIIVVSAMSEPVLLRPFLFIFIISGFMHIFYKITSHKNQLA